MRRSAALGRRLGALGLGAATVLAATQAWQSYSNTQSSSAEADLAEDFAALEDTENH
jgi:hypothetical protein